ncbi:MAG: hypothetical protein M1358_08240, partial [Chloroflexi bacterium]|nr:hypothetical protein [Chloroflexota bacterium]
TEGAVVKHPDLPAGTASCYACPLGCEIRPGHMGACKRWINEEGVGLVRSVPLVPLEEVSHRFRAEDVSGAYHPATRRPLVTAIGAGTRMGASPCIVADKVDGVDVVSAVSEIPLCFSALRVKLDAEEYIGETGADVLYRNHPVGKVEAAEYGCQFLYLAGPEYLPGRYGWLAFKAAADLANGERAKLRVKGGSTLELQAGQRPVIDGKEIQNRIWGCGNQTGLYYIADGATAYKPYFHDVADLIVVLHRWLAGSAVEKVAELPANPWSRPEDALGIKLKDTSPARFVYAGKGAKGGWGASYHANPMDILEIMDVNRLAPGFTIYFTDPPGTRAAMYRLNNSETFEPIELTPQARLALEKHRGACEPARVTCFLVANIGGGARSSLTSVDPIKVSKAVQDKRIALSVGGAPVDYVWPGGGINLMVNVEKLTPGIVSWNSVPCLIIPIEFTMTMDVFKEIEGHVQFLKPLAEVLKSPRERLPQLPWYSTV